MCGDTPHEESEESGPVRGGDGLGGRPFELSTLVNAYVNGRVTESEMDRLNSLLRADEASQDVYLQIMDLHSCVSIDESVWVPSQVAVDRSHGMISLVRESTKRLARSMPRVALFSLFIAIPISIVFVAVFLQFAPWPAADVSIAQSVATIGELKNCWLNGSVRPPATGSSVTRGQRFDLASGAMQIRFASGALAMIHGPAIFDISSRNSGFLRKGKVNVTACAADSTNFSLNTANAKAVHHCAEFIVEVASNGRTRFDVSKGSLNVFIPEIELSQRLESGGAIEFEGGSENIMTIIESGDESPEFRFPTIPSPSSSDLADRTNGVASAHRYFGDLEEYSAPPEILFDGRGQSAADRPDEALVFLEDTTGGFVLDLGKPTSISTINTYSWHRSDFRWYQTDKSVERAPQKYDLYGFAGEELPSADTPIAESGWKLIARVNTDDFFQIQHNSLRPAQQATSIRSSQGKVGVYRYLMWVVRPSVGYLSDREFGTLYGEVDVYGE